MEEVGENGNANRQQQHDDGAFSCAASPAAGGGAADEQQHMQSFRNDVPVFLDQTFRMIENVPDHIVSWSRAGDSFIIKQVLVFEEILPSYYNHNKFLSFVRQLNFYGFKKVKRRASSSPTFVTCPGGQGAGAMGAAAAATESDSWEEFSHPQFRRGRRDLLAGIKRQKDKGRSKRKQAETHKSDMLSDLATKLDDMSDELRAVNGKLDDTISLLSVHRSNLFLEHQNDGIYGGSGGGGGGGVVASFGGGNAGPYGFRAPIVDYASPRLAIDQQHHPQHHQRHQQEQEWHGNQLYSQQYQQASGREQDPATPNEVQHHMVQPPQPLPPLAAVAARASGPSADGALRHRLPPPYLPPRNSEINLQLVSYDEKRGGRHDGGLSMLGSPNINVEGVDSNSV